MTVNKWFRPKTLEDKVFEGGIIIKGIDGLLELIGGFLLFFFSPEAINNFIVFITHREIAQDPHDFVANLLLNSTQHLNDGGRIFLIVYLWIHAAVKLVAVIGILKNKLWAYPFSLITLGALVLYQIYDIFFVAATLGIILLTIFDIIILGFIWNEYGKMKRTSKIRS